jgi:hypothetical protein
MRSLAKLEQLLQVLSCQKMPLSFLKFCMFVTAKVQGEEGENLTFLFAAIGSHVDPM